MKLLTPPVLDVPPMAPPVTVVADVHLAEDEPEVVKHFLDYLDRVAERGGTLLILGDLFDGWWGPPQANEPFYRKILDRLARLNEQGLSFSFMPGNRDFLVGYDGEAGFEPWPDPVRTTWGHKRVLLTHGDLLCTADHGYQRMRRIFRWPNGKPRRALKIFPWPFYRWLAGRIKVASNRATKTKPKAWMDIDYGAAKVWLDTYDVDMIVAGHVHTGVHHRLPGENGTPDRDVYVVKDWQAGGGVVLFDERGIRLVRPERG